MEKQAALWYWIRCVWLMLPVGWGSQNSRRRRSHHISLSSLLPQFFTINSSFQPFMSTLPLSLSEALSHVYFFKPTSSSEDTTWGRGSVSLRLCHWVPTLAPQTQSHQSGSDSPWCLSQDLCPCCQCRVLLRGGGVGWEERRVISGDGDGVNR